MARLDWHGRRDGPDGRPRLDGASQDAGIDHGAVRRYRLARVRNEIAKRAIAALILSDPVNIRYATGTRNMQVFTARNAPSLYLLLTAERSTLYEHHLMRAMTGWSSPAWCCVSRAT